MGNQEQFYCLEGSEHKPSTIPAHPFSGAGEKSGKQGPFLTNFVKLFHFAGIN